MHGADERVDPPRVFVYGTLQPGRLRWPFLAPFAVAHRPASVSGEIFDTGHGWPVAVFAVSARRVPGTLVDLAPDRAVQALRVLDDVEATATDLLRRIAVTTTAGDRAWTYHCDQPTDSMTLIRRWEGVAER